MARTGFATLFARLRPPDAYPGNAVTDSELLRRYAEGRDPAAFELLVWRHGPLVLGTCRRVARHEADAEDAFQATFLVLARKAGGVRQSLPGWLHRTARRAALRAVSRRRVATLTADVPSTPRPGLDADELTLLDAAIDGLGERHRRVVVLCYLQGHTADAAATILGVPRGTVLSRLSTARARLAKTLTRRGVTLPAALVTATLSFDRVAACVELTLNPRAAVPAAAIAQGVLTMMLRHQLAVTAVALTLVGVGVTGTGVALMPQPGGNGPPVPAAVAAKKDEPAAKPDADVVHKQQLRSTLDQLLAEIDTVKDDITSAERKNPPMSDAMLRAKTSLLSQIESQLFQKEVTVQTSQLKLDELTRQFKQLDRKNFTESEITAYIAVDGKAEQTNRAIDDSKIIKGKLKLALRDTVANPTDPLVIALEEQLKASDARYQQIENARRSRAIDLLFVGVTQFTSFVHQIFRLTIAYFWFSPEFEPA